MADLESTVWWIRTAAASAAVLLAILATKVVAESMTKFLACLSADKATAAAWAESPRAKAHPMTTRRHTTSNVKKGRLSMPLFLPNFPLVCKIWRYHAPPYATTDPGAGSSACALRVYRNAGVFTASQGALYMGLLLPKATDIRGAERWAASMGQGDVVECPAASGRFYTVVAVDDEAKGTAFEYRFAVLVQAPQAPPFPIP